MKICGLCSVYYLNFIQSTSSDVTSDGINQNDISQSVNNDVYNFTKIENNVFLEDAKKKVANICGSLLDRSVLQQKESGNFDMTKKLEYSLENAHINLWKMFFDILSLKLNENIEEVSTHFITYQNIINNLKTVFPPKNYLQNWITRTNRLLSDCVIYIPKMVINGNLDDAYNYINNFCMLFKIEFNEYIDKSKKLDLPKELDEAITANNNSKNAKLKTIIQEEFIDAMIPPNDKSVFMRILYPASGLITDFSLSNTPKKEIGLYKQPITCGINQNTDASSLFTIIRPNHKSNYSWETKISIAQNSIQPPDIRPKHDFNLFITPNICGVDQNNNSQSLTKKNVSVQTSIYNLYTKKKEEVNENVNPLVSFEERRIIEITKKCGILVS